MFKTRKFFALLTAACMLTAFSLTSCSGGGGGGGGDSSAPASVSMDNVAVGNYTIAGNSYRAVQMNGTSVTFIGNNSSISGTASSSRAALASGSYTVTLTSGTIGLTVSGSDVTVTGGTLAASGSGKTEGSLIAHLKLESRNFTRKDLVQSSGGWKEKSLLKVGDELWIYSNNTAIMAENGQQMGPVWTNSKGTNFIFAEFSNSNLNASGTTLDVGFVSPYAGSYIYQRIAIVTSSGNGTMIYNHSDSGDECMKGIDGNSYSTSYTETWKILN